MILNKAKIAILFISISSSFISCKKDWLDAKPQKSLVVPTTIADYQALLDNNDRIFNASYTAFGELGAGDFNITTNAFASGLTVEKNLYEWIPDIFQNDPDSYDWGQTYNRIFYANVVLEGISKIHPNNATEINAWNDVRGGALFHRAFNHFSMSQLYCKPYDKNTASGDLGIPLRVESDINIPSVRSSVQETYDQIIADLKEAILVLPILTPINDLYQLRPTRAASMAMLARVYLSMENYDSAFVYADKCLQLYSILMDYNGGPGSQVSTTGTFPFPRFNDEVLFHASMVAPTYFGTSFFNTDSTLLQLYNSANDLRMQRFFLLFQGTRYLFRGSYNSNISSFFAGLATDEIYLIRAECYARKGDIANGMKDLNDLLRTRWKKDPITGLTLYVNQTAIDLNDALKKIISERRKELCFRAIRWSDLRRLNRDPQFAITLKRAINNQIYVLPPNDNKYVLPIPTSVILLTGMQQNPRN